MNFIIGMVVGIVIGLALGLWFHVQAVRMDRW